MKNLIPIFLFLFGFAASAQKPAKELYEGITKGDLERVKKAVEAGADVNKAVSMKKPLDWAIQTHRIDVLQYLLEKGANVNDKTMIGTPLQQYAGRVETPEKTAEWYQNFYTKRKIDTVIQVSWYSDIAEITNALLDAGADPNEKDLSGRTVLQSSIEMGIGSEEARAQFIDALLKHKNKPDVNQRLITIDAKKQNHLDFTLKNGKLKDPEKFPTALMICAKMGLTKIAKVLIDNGADVNALVNYYGSKSEGNFYTGITLYATKSQLTALDIAKSKKNNDEMVKLLVAAGAR